MVDAHVTSRRMPAMKPVGERSAGNPHVRFDERGGETDRSNDTAPLLDSTTRRVHRGCESERSVVQQQFLHDPRYGPMPTECTPKRFEFEAVARRSVVAGFDGGNITPNAG